MDSVISALYHGALRPNEFCCMDSRMELLLGSFKQDEDWVEKNLEGSARERVLELVNIHDELDGMTRYQSFRRGFILGARLVMEICTDNEQEEA